MSCSVSADYRTLCPSATERRDGIKAVIYENEDTKSQYDQNVHKQPVKQKAVELNDHT
jgi:hypothetical protein